MIKTPVRALSKRISRVSTPVVHKREATVLPIIPLYSKAQTISVKDLTFREVMSAIDTYHDIVKNEKIIQNVRQQLRADVLELSRQNCDEILEEAERFLRMLNARVYYNQRNAEIIPMPTSNKRKSPRNNAGTSRLTKKLSKGVRVDNTNNIKSEENRPQITLAEFVKYGDIVTTDKIDAMIAINLAELLYRWYEPYRRSKKYQEYSKKLRPVFLEILWHGRNFPQALETGCNIEGLRNFLAEEVRAKDSNLIDEYIAIYLAVRFDDATRVRSLLQSSRHLATILSLRDEDGRNLCGHCESDDVHLLLTAAMKKWSEPSSMHG